jgi:hypothetical protein
MGPIKVEQGACLVPRPTSAGACGRSAPEVANRLRHARRRRVFLRDPRALTRRRTARTLYRVMFGLYLERHVAVLAIWRGAGEALVQLDIT